VFKKLKNKINQLFKNETKNDKYKKMLKNLENKVIKLKDKKDDESKEEVLIIKQLIKKIQNKIDSN